MLAIRRKFSNYLFTHVLERAYSAHLTTVASDAINRRLKKYADWRVGATPEEMRAHKATATILLTFDDGGTTEQVTALLSALEREGVMAMFFPRGDWAAEHPQLLKAIQCSGHIVGNHTYSHPDLLQLSDSQVRDELSRGVQSPWLRPPRGRYNARIRRIGAALGFKLVYWDIDSDDWKGVSRQYMSHKILSQLHPGAVILFHMDGKHTASLLPTLISAIRKRGYELCSFNEPPWDSKP